jgi:hypothetical protein
VIAWAILALCGAVVCSFCDHLHVAYGVLSYPHPDAFDQAWWVPLLFGAASLAAVLGARPIRALFGAPVGEIPSARQIVADGIAFVSAYAFTSFGHERPDAVTFVLVAWWLTRVVRGREPWAIAYSLVVAVAGPAFEAGYSSLGFFAYRTPDFVGIPRWLPAVYLHAGLLAATLDGVYRGGHPPAHRSRPA